MKMQSSKNKKQAVIQNNKNGVQRYNNDKYIKNTVKIPTSV